MVATSKKRVTEKLGDLDKDEEVLRPKDRSTAKGLRGKARTQAKQADEPAGKTAAMNLAAHNAAEAAKKHGKKKEPKGKKDDAKQNSKKAAEAERVVSGTLKETFHLSATQKFDPIKRVVKMHNNGTESMEILPGGKKPQLKIAGMPSDNKLAQVYKHLIPSLNPSAREAVSATMKRIGVEFKAIDEVSVMGGRVARLAYQDLEKIADRIDKEVAALGSRMMIENFARVLKTPPPIFKPPIPVWFQINATPSPRYQQNFVSAMAEQLGSQERKLNAFNIDRWVARVDTFKSQSYKWFKDLDRNARPAVGKEISAKLREAADETSQRAKQLEEVRANLEKLTDNAPADDEALEWQIANLKLNEKALKREQRRAHSLEPARLKLAEFLEKNGTLNDLRPAQAKQFVALAKRAKVVGRSGDERLWKDIHRAAIREIITTKGEKEDWDGLKVLSEAKLAPLHDPDQVASGHGRLPDVMLVKKPAAGSTDAKAWKAWKDYVTKVREFVGPAWINSIIGGSWGNAIVTAKNDVVAKYPPPTFPLWMMNLTLGWTQKG